MLAEKKVQEECLYCHGKMELRNSCPMCGDTKWADSLRPDPSTRPTVMFHPVTGFEPKIAGV